MDLAELRKKFPQANKSNCRFASLEDPQYNCIAWAADVNDIWWEPDPGFQYFWPLRAERTYSIRAYHQAFGTKGYIPCADAELEQGFQKVALYAKNNVATHAARQLDSGWWTSKLGRDVDIEHTLPALDNGDYGGIVGFLKRAAKSESQL